MTIVIEKSVPLNDNYKKKYPFADMEVGDSFYAEGQRAPLANSSYMYGKRHGKKFSTRAEGSGFRVWRIA